MEKLNFWSPVVWQSLSVVGFFLVVFLLVVIITETRSKKIIAVRLKIVQAILSGKLLDFLKVIKKIPSNVFDDADISSKASDFLFSKLIKDDLHYIFFAYKTLTGDGRKEAAEIFEKAFEKKKLSFWTEIYFSNIVSGQGDKLKEYQEYFEVFTDETIKTIYLEISKKIKNFIERRLDLENHDLKKVLEDEIRRIKILLG